ncbi:MAG: hypothetical protein EPO08_14235 [Rhodospirillaceae bacterium]|nr:MAG: hypothetical protein EPO08_14235 [Rhodospirillaceae bacterium]
MPEARIRADLQLLATVTRRIRTYSVGNGMDRVPEIARPLGMKVSLGIWLGPDKAENSKEIAKALTVIAANADVIDRVFVGSETLQRKDLPLKDIIASLRRVRHAVRGRNIEVTTGEIWSVWLANPSLGQECDVIGVHIHPYWDGYSVGEAVNGVIARLEQIQQEFPGKRVIIAETGWPSVGAVRGAAAPSPAGQAYFTSAFLDEARTRQLDYYIVEAFDQPWKVGGEGEVGTGWGLFDVKTRSKLNLAGISPLAPE